MCLKTAVMAMVFCLLSTGVTGRPVGAAVNSGDLTLTAQNFHIYTSGNLRFVFGIKSDALVKDLTADSTAFFRVTLGQRITAGEKQVQEIYAKPELFSAIDSVDLSLREVTRRADGQFEVIALSTDIPSGTRRIEFDGPGIYPVRVEIVVGTTTRATLTTFVNRFDPSRETKPMPVNIVAALDAPITLRPDGSRRIDAATRAKIEKIISLLKLNAAKVTVQISPELIEGLSKSADPIDQSLLVQLVAALSEVPLVTTTYIRFDPSAASANDQIDEFNSLLERGTTTWQQVSPSSKIINSVWIARDPIDQKGLDLLAESGVRSIVMLPNSSAVLGEFDNAARPYRLQSKDKTTPVDLALHLVDKSYVAQLSSPNNDTFAAASFLSAQILAQRNQVENEGGTSALRRVVLTSSDGSIVNPNLLRETVLILSRVPQQVVMRTLGNLPAPRLDAYVPSLPPVDAANLAQSKTIVETLRTDIDKLNTTIAADANVWREWDELLLVMSSDSMTSTLREEFILATRDQLKKIRQSVTLQSGTTFTLGSRESQLRLDLQNSSNFAMTIQVKVASPKLRFSKDTATVEIAANSSKELVVDVVALANGLFPVEVRIFTADGLSQLGKKIEVSARVNALAGLGQIVSGVALLLLATWWVAHIRRKFRKKISKNHPVLRSKP
jgi:hypothetical protein